MVVCDFLVGMNGGGVQVNEDHRWILRIRNRVALRLDSLDTRMRYERALRWVSGDEWLRLINRNGLAKVLYPRLRGTVDG